MVTTCAYLLVNALLLPLVCWPVCCIAASLAARKHRANVERMQRVKLELLFKRVGKSRKMARHSPSITARCRAFCTSCNQLARMLLADSF